MKDTQPSVFNIFLSNRKLFDLKDFRHVSPIWGLKLLVSLSAASPFCSVVSDASVCPLSRSAFSPCESADRLGTEDSSVPPCWPSVAPLRLLSSASTCVSLLSMWLNMTCFSVATDGEENTFLRGSSGFPTCIPTCQSETYTF